MTTTANVALVPRDGFFVKDGRGWYTSASGRAHGLDWPWPSTVLGALRAAWGRGDEARNDTTFTPADWRAKTAPIRLGRTLVVRRRQGTDWRIDDTVWPAPMDALRFENSLELHRLEPVPHAVPTLGRDDDEARENLWRPTVDDARKPLTGPRWWRNDDFMSWLAGGAVTADSDAPAITRRVQAHVGIRPEELTADDGILFSHDVVETLDRCGTESSTITYGEWAIGVEVMLPDSELPELATLGADSRLARVESLPAALFEPATRVLDAFRATSAGLRLVAVSPLCFARGWLPDGIAESGGAFRGCLPGLDHEVILRAAFVPRPIHVSGWDMATGQPKPTSRMVSPGAVYFFERADGKPFGETDAWSLWLTALGARTDEGFGRVVPGVWSPARNIP